MSKKTPRLGRGLEAIIPKTFLSSGKTIMHISVESIEPNPFQPRLHFDESALTDLAKSIERYGLSQPILVRPKQNSYELIAGERRLRASKLAKLDTIPAIVKQLSDQEALELAMVENMDREDLNAMEISRGYQRLINEFNATHEEIGLLFNKSRSTISNSLRLLQLPESIQEGLITSKISEGHGRALLAISNVIKMIEVYNKIIKENWSVRQTEQAIQFMNIEKKTPVKTDAELKKQIKKLSKQIKIPLKINGTNDKGKMTISYRNPEEKDKIIGMLELMNTESFT